MYNNNFDKFLLLLIIVTMTDIFLEGGWEGSVLKLLLQHLYCVPLSIFKK